MQIEVTRDEYKSLIELVYIAEWILHGFKTETPPQTEQYRKIAQKLYSHGKRFGFENLVGYDKDLDQYFPSGEFEEKCPCLEYIEEFEEDSFWFELTGRLAERDMIRQVGEEQIRSMSIEELFEKEGVYWEKYTAEFEARGLDNLIIEN